MSQDKWANGNKPNQAKQTSSERFLLVQIKMVVLKTEKIKQVDNTFIKIIG
jgi:hypothetical protein